MLLAIRRFVAPIFFVLVAVTIATFGILSMYTTAYAVTIDGETYDVFDNKEDVKNAIKNVENKVEDVLDKPYEISNDVQCEKVFVLKSHVTGNTDDLEEVLYDDVDEITDTFILKVDGETIGIGDEEDLQQVIDDVTDEYVNDNTVSVKVLSDVEINYETVPSELEEDTDVMTESLTEIVEDEVTYEVSETKTLKEAVEDVNIKIEDTDISTEQVLTLNPELTDKFIDNDDAENNIDSDNEEIKNKDTDDTKNTDNTDNIDIDNEDDIDSNNSDNSENDNNSTDNEDIEESDTDNKNIKDADDIDVDEEDNEELDIDNSLTISEIAEESAEDIVLEEGSVLTVEPEKSLLVVETQDVETHNKEIEYDTIEEEDDELYIGETEIRIEGENGLAKVSELITKLNGKEVERVQQEYTVTEEPVDEVIAIGTKEYIPEPEIIIPDNIVVDTDGNVINSNFDSDTIVDYNDNSNTTTDVNNNTYYTSESYIWPLANYGTSSISSSYGWRYINGSSEFHNGIDIAAPGGTPIRASNDGIVITNTYNNARGYYVQIQHNDGYITTYQHMNSPAIVAVNSYVSQGQTIGYVGSTGDSTGNHLHFEVWTSDYTAINPMILFTSNSTNSPTTTNTNYTVSYNSATYSDNNLTTSDNEPTSLQNEIVEYAEQFLGCPYVHAGHGPDVFDCSGFTGYVYRHFGIEIYNSVECQLQYGTDVPIDVSQMQPGDLIFFATTGIGQATHVGMYIGDGQYIHASSTYGQVMIDTVRSTTNRPIVAVKRIV